jgi:hypothetical protein
MRPHLLVVALAAALTLAAGCSDSSPTHPTITPPPSTNPGPGPAPAPAAVSRLVVSGNAALTAIAQTSQLTSTATLTDGTTRDVTKLCSWLSSDPATMTVNGEGVVTVLRYGQSFISANYSGKGSGLSIFATPAGTFVLYGRVREPGNGGVLGARVLESSSGRSVLTDGNGDYSMGDMTAASLVIEKDGFEPVKVTGNPGKFDDVPLQRVNRLASDGTLNMQLAPHDVEYTPMPGSACSPCRMIRVTAAEAGTLHLKVTWTETHSTLSIWANGQLFEGTARGPSEVAGDVAVVAGELQIYVGMKTPSDYYVPATLTAAIVK